MASQRRLGLVTSRRSRFLQISNTLHCIFNSHCPVRFLCTQALTLEEERALHGFLCQLMVDSRYTYAIAEHFRPILLQLASQLIEHKFASPITASPGILADLISAALSRLLPLQPKLLE